MVIDTRILKMVLVGCAALLRSVTAEASSCISIRQPPVVDPAFSPISLQFDVHVTSQWNGVGNSTAVDRSFTEGMTIGQSFLRSLDPCNESISIVANVESSASANTTDISNHVGRDFSLIPDRATLTARDTGYVIRSFPGGSIGFSTYQLAFSLSAADYRPISSDGLHFDYADYARRISLDEYGLEGYYTQMPDLASYLQSHIGTSGHYEDLVTITGENYQVVDKYGFEGTATLADVRVVPEPATFGMLAAGLAMLCSMAPRGKERDLAQARLAPRTQRGRGPRPAVGSFSGLANKSRREIRYPRVS